MMSWGAVSNITAPGTIASTGFRGIRKSGVARAPAKAMTAESEAAMAAQSSLDRFHMVGSQTSAENALQAAEQAEALVRQTLQGLATHGAC